ncbi:MAG: polymer-forming cytoskeletal protein [Anaerolineales bacterium]|uniref:polymer-forming cytoskeletal protein n=1 Tax=Candidatus Villigracilis vicinus TaxID=3140679 RepID=UPI00313661F6|nr:polymer-forming cytoskeletal protein [Anaerolineales bacterium]
MKTIQRILAIFTLAAILSLTIVSPALAFDGRAGDVILIKTDEVINDDLYVTADEFTLDGTIKGDLVVFGSYIVINGTVEGDLIAAGNTIVITGTVKDDARIAGAALQLDEKAVIGGDLVSAGASLEVKDGSTVGNDVVFAGAQGLLAGSIERNLMVGAGALELRGEVGGNVQAEVGEAEEGSPSPSMYMGDTKVSIPNVKPGLTVADSAKIKGDFTYTQSADIDLPSSVVDGKVTRNEPAVDEENIPTPPTAGETALTWVFDLLRKIVTLAIFGLLLVWLAPAFLKGLSEKLQAQPVPSFGWGVVAYAAFFFALLLIVVAMTVGGILFGIISLGGITATIIWVGILALFALTLGFVLFTGFGAQALVAWMSGKWILNRFNPALAEHKVWPMLLGVVIVGLLVKLPFVGWLIGFLIMFFGLGALWLWSRELTKKPVVSEA